MIVKGTDIYLTRGDTAKLTLEITLQEQFEIQKLFFTVKKSIESTTPLISHKWERDSGGDHLEQNIIETEPNTFIVSIDHEDTADKPFGKYRYDVQINYIDTEEAEPEVRILTIVKPSIFVLQDEVTLEGVS